MNRLYGDGRKRPKRIRTSDEMVVMLVIAWVIGIALFLWILSITGWGRLPY